MSDERDLTPEQEARVARLLADARVEGPMPPEVAARLDRVLGGLAGEPVAGPPERHAPVVDLAARRRRRVRNLLVAAAAVVVVGVGVGQLVDTQDDGDDASPSMTADAGENGGGKAERNAVPKSADQGAESGLTSDELQALGGPARLSTHSFAKAVRRLQDRPGVRSEAASGLMTDSDLAAPGMDFRCAPTDFGRGKLIPVLYNGSPAVLVYRPPAGDTQVVELMQCRSGAILRSSTIPLP